MIALNVVSSEFSSLFSSRAFAAKTGPEIGVPWNHFCANHKYKAVSNCLFCASFIVFRLLDKSMLSTLVVYSLNSFRFISDMVDFPTSYSFASDVIVIDFPFLQICSLSSIDRTVHFCFFGFLAILTLQLDLAIFADRKSRDGLRGGPRSG